MESDVPDKGLKEALEGLEKSALTPVVSGESEAWLQNLVRVHARIQAEFTQRVRPVHDKLYVTIGEADPELLAHVEQMELEDEAIAAELANLGPKASSIIAQISQQQWNETMIEEALRQLSDSAVALVIRIRKQETALATWLGEALNRDRGTAD